MESDSGSKKLNTYIQPIINSKFPISKILGFEGKIIPITVKQVPMDVKFCDMPVFGLLVDKFNEIQEKNYSFDQILYSKSRFSAFYNFVFYLAISGKLKVVKSVVPNFMERLQELQNEYSQNARSIEKYYDEIVEKVYYPQSLTKNDNKVKQDMYYFEQAYSMVKLVFKDLFRDDLTPDNERIRYFEHLKGTMEIIIRELPNPNIRKIVVALLHDIVEDIKGFNIDILRFLYGDDIANSVVALSKKPWKSYLNADETKQYSDLERQIKELFAEVNPAKRLFIEVNPDFVGEFENVKKTFDLESELLDCMNEEQKIKYQTINSKMFEYEMIGKERRNDEYFGHLDELDDDTLDDKIADRIHNLRTMHPYSKQKIWKKIEQTEKYFMDVVQKRNPQAYELIMIELEKLKKLIAENDDKKSE